MSLKPSSESTEPVSAAGMTSSLSFLRLVLGLYPARCALLVVFLLLAGVAEGFSILAILPLLGLTIGDGGSEASTIYRIMEAFLSAFGAEIWIESLLVLMIAGALLKALLTLLAGQQVGYAAAQVGTDMRMGLMRAMIDADWRHYASQPVGKLSNAVSSESTRASAAFLAGGQFAAAVVQVLIFLVSAALVSWTLTVLAMGTGGLLVVALRRTVRNTRAASDQMTGILRKLSARFADGVQGIKPIKAMAQKQNLLKLLESENWLLHKTQERRVFNKWLLRSAQEPVVVVCLAAGFYTAYVHSDLGIEKFMVMGFLFARTVNKIGAMQSHFQMMVSTESAFLSLHDTIRQAEAVRERVTGAALPELKEEIKFEHVSFAFDGIPVLRDVTLEIPARQMTAIIGPSGSGKTTIVDLIVGLFQPSQGTILCDGHPLRDADLMAWRQSIGYVPQELFLFHGDLLTNVTLGDPHITEAQVERALRAAGAWAFVQALPDGLATRMGERGLRVSGGQRQRIALARALVRKPKLLILDEPTTALDPLTEIEVCATLKRLTDEMTILAVSHQPAILKVADRVYQIQDGCIGVTHNDPAVSNIATAISHETTLQNMQERRARRDE